MTYQKVTFIDDLPELDQVNEDEERANKVKRFVRNTRNIKDIDELSGMRQMSTQQQLYIPSQEPVMYEHEQKDVHISCQDIFLHTSDCPICRRFYKQDNTVYLIIIGVLILTCALLFKKVLNV